MNDELSHNFQNMHEYSKNHSVNVKNYLVKYKRMQLIRRRKMLLLCCDSVGNVSMASTRYGIEYQWSIVKSQGRFIRR